MPLKESVFKKKKKKIASLKGTLMLFTDVKSLMNFNTFEKNRMWILKWTFLLSHCALVGENFLYFYFLSLGPCQPLRKEGLVSLRVRTLLMHGTLADLRPLLPKKRMPLVLCWIFMRGWGHIFVTWKTSINKFVIWHKNTLGWSSISAAPI